MITRPAHTVVVASADFSVVLVAAGVYQVSRAGQMGRTYDSATAAVLAAHAGEDA